MASGRIQPGSRQWVEAMRRLSGTEDTTVDMSMGRKVSRDAAIPHGMGTAALDTRLRGEGGGGIPPTVEGPFDAADWEILPVGGSWARIIRYVMTSAGTPSYSIEFNRPPGPPASSYGFRVEEDGLFVGNFGVAAFNMPEVLNIQSLSPETARRLTVTFIEGGDQTLFDVSVPEFWEPNQAAPPGFPPPPTTAQRVQSIIGDTVGFALDPFDFSVMLTTGNIPATALGQPILRQNAKWGSAPGFFSGGGIRPALGAQGLMHPVSATANATTNGDTLMRTFFSGRSAIFICQAMQPPRRPASRAQIFAASQVSGALGRLTLHTDHDLSVTLNYRRTDLGDGAGKVELPPDTLTPGQRTIVTCEVDFVNGGARIWADGVLGNSSPVPAPGGSMEATLGARTRYGLFTAGGANEFFEGGLGRAVVLPFIPTAAQRKVIEAWVAEPAEVALATVANPTLTERVQAILRQTKGFVLDPQDLTTLWQDDEAITPVTAPGQPVGAIRSKFGNTSYTYRATDPIVTTYEGGAISFDGMDGGLINPSDNFTTGNTGMVVVARMAAAADQFDDAPVVAFLGVGGGPRLSMELKSDLRPAFSVARPDANELQITGTTPMTPGQAHTLSVRALFFGAPAPVQGFLDGVLAAEGVLTGTPATTDAPVSPFGGLGQLGDTALQFSGYVGRVVCAHFFQTDKDRQAFEAWVADGPWPASPPG